MVDKNTTRPAKLLSQLIPGIPGIISHTGGDGWINGIAQDSRRVQTGDLFVAYAGGSTDGHRFIPAAIQNGASAVLGTQPIGELAVPYIQVKDSRLAMAHIAAAFWGHPARKLLMIGVTGTDGKTTTSTLIYNILRWAGLQTGMISTVNAIIGDQEIDTGFHVTTPDSLDVQHYLALMVDAGITHVVLETTSHGLAQQRVAACDFDLAVVTNITHEHLDFHGSYEEYRKAKGLLFSGLKDTPQKAFATPGCAVLNRDDSSFRYLEKISPVDQISYGRHKQADLRAMRVKEKVQGLEFMVKGMTLEAKDYSFPVKTELIGGYNVSNCLAAIGACVGALGVEPEIARLTLASIKSVPGRMEAIDLGQDFQAIVDFAHTPNALKNVLHSARNLTRGRVIAIFGSAGLRDRAKRRMMAETSAELADLTILTAEDPRTESLDGILEAMAEGMVARGGNEGVTFWRVPDRGDALRFAVRLARPGDLVIACGKGHEQSMCFGDVEYPWDDRVALRAALSEYLNIPGPQMPVLPTQG